MPWYTRIVYVQKRGIAQAAGPCCQWTESFQQDAGRLLRDRENAQVKIQINSTAIDVSGC